MSDSQNQIEVTFIGPADELFPHRISCAGTNVTALRGRIEHKLGVETTATRIGSWTTSWNVNFVAPKNTNFDFLRPDVLPPK